MSVISVSYSRGCEAMVGAEDKEAAEVEKLLLREDVEVVEDGVAEAAAKTRAPTEAERPTAQVGRRETRSCLDAVRKPRVTADIGAVVCLLLESRLMQTKVFLLSSPQVR